MACYTTQLRNHCSLCKFFLSTQTSHWNRTVKRQNSHYKNNKFFSIYERVSNQIDIYTQHIFYGHSTKTCLVHNFMFVVQWTRVISSIGPLIVAHSKNIAYTKLIITILLEKYRNIFNTSILSIVRNKCVLCLIRRQPETFIGLMVARMSTYAAYIKCMNMYILCVCVFQPAICACACSRAH